MSKGISEGKTAQQMDRLFDITSEILEDPSLYEAQKLKIDLSVGLGEVTAKEGDELKRSMANMKSLTEKIPKGLEHRDRRRAFDLVMEKQNIKRRSKKLDEALAKPYKKRIAQIDEELNQIIELNKPIKETTEDLKAEERVEESHGVKQTSKEEAEGVLEDFFEADEMEAVEIKDGKNNKEAKGRYITENFNYQIEKGEDGLVFYNMDGSDADLSKSAVTKYELEYLSAQDWSQSKSELEGLELDQSMNPNEVIADISENVYEVATALQDELNQKIEYSPLEEFLDGQKINTKSFIDNSDRSNITNTLARSWLRKGAKPLDALAKEAENEIYGDYNANTPRITEQDIVSTVLDNPANYLSKKTDVALALEKKFRRLTGTSATMQNLKAVTGVEIKSENSYTENQKTEVQSEIDDVLFSLREVLRGNFLTFTKD